MDQVSSSVSSLSADEGRLALTCVPPCPSVSRNLRTRDQVLLNLPVLGPHIWVDGCCCAISRVVLCYPFSVALTPLRV